MATIAQIFSEYTQNPDHHVGSILRIKMDFHKLKQNDVARRAGVTIATLSNILNGLVRPKHATVQKIETAIAGLAHENPHHTA